MTIVLAFDAAWGGLGWAVCGPKGPLGSLGDAIGWASFPSDLQDRYGRLVLELSRAFDVAEARRRVSGGELFVTVEEPPQVHGRANQASTSIGLGKCVGAVHLYARVRLPTVRPPLAQLYSEEAGIADWRRDYRPMLRGPDWKGSAVECAAKLWPGMIPITARRKLREDTSEAVLIGVHTARRLDRGGR